MRFRRCTLSLTALLVGLAPAHASILDGDQRMDQSAYLTAEEESLYSGVGRIECPAPGSTRHWVATGWLVEGFDTVITASHAFYQIAHPPETLHEYHSPPTDCTFNTYDRFGNLRDSISIIDSFVKWDSPQYHGDFSNDYAVVKLSRPPNHSIRWLQLAGKEKMNGVAITLLSFGIDLPDSQRVRKSRGMIYEIPKNGPVRPGKTLSDPSRVCATSVDSEHGSSGGMYVNAAGQAVCIHVNSISPDGKGRPGSFDLMAPNYNIGIFINLEIYDAILSVKNSKVK
jgi:hypothetical protein